MDVTLGEPEACAWSPRSGRVRSVVGTEYVESPYTSQAKNLSVWAAFWKPLITGN